MQHSFVCKFMDSFILWQFMFLFIVYFCQFMYSFFPLPIHVFIHSFFCQFIYSSFSLHIHLLNLHRFRILIYPFISTFDDYFLIFHIFLSFKQFSLRKIWIGNILLFLLLWIIRRERGRARGTKSTKYPIFSRCFLHGHFLHFFVGSNFRFF